LQIATAPDGNGGVYRALVTSGALSHMQTNGVKALDCCSVDNAAARVVDPLFIGACAAVDAQLGARVVAKAFPDEKVGIFARCECVPCAAESLSSEHRKFIKLTQTQLCAASIRAGDKYVCYNTQHLLAHVDVTFAQKLISLPARYQNIQCVDCV
jgi:UDP-N-acetylglucosamine/UDP-N-acetylgalactosamine diphosphorylase